MTPTAREKTTRPFSMSLRQASNHWALFVGIVSVDRVPVEGLVGVTEDVNLLQSYLREIGTVCYYYS